MDLVLIGAFSMDATFCWKWSGVVALHSTASLQRLPEDPLSSWALNVRLSPGLTSGGIMHLANLPSSVLSSSTHAAPNRYSPSLNGLPCLMPR